MRKTPSEKASKEKQYSVTAVRYTLRILEMLSESEASIGPSEVSARLGVNKNMSFRILRTMEDEGWIIRKPDESRYIMGLRPFHYVSRVTDRMDCVTASEASMEQLWREKGCLLLLCVLDGLRLTCIRKWEQRGDFRYTVGIGTHHYLHNSAPGKVLLAWHEKELFDSLVAEGLISQTRYTITDPEKLREHLAEVREKGYALDRFECAEGLICLAAPIFDYSGQCVASVNTAVLTANYTEERLLAELKNPIMEVGRLSSIALGCCFNQNPS